MSILKGTVAALCFLYLFGGEARALDKLEFQNSGWYCDLNTYALLKYSKKTQSFSEKDFSPVLGKLKTKIAFLKSDAAQSKSSQKKLKSLINRKKFISKCKKQLLGDGEPSPSPTPSPDPSPTPSPPGSTPTPTPTPGTAPNAPAGLGVMSGDKELTVSWEDVTGATSYNLYFSTTSGRGTSGTEISGASNPHIHGGLSNGVPYYYVVTAVNEFGESPPSEEASGIPLASGSTAYDPPWGKAVPTSVIAFDYNSAQTSAQNGAALKTAILALTAGKKIVIGGGLYDLPTSNFNLNPQGTVVDPIWIVAKDGETPIIRMPTTSKNIVDMCNASGGARYAVIRGIEFTGGSAGIRFHQCDNIWFDQNHVHDTDDAALTTNTYDTHHMYITRNHIHNTGGYGEGMYLGANNGAVKMSASIIALNHVHDTYGAIQGDGIELKQGSYNNWVAENTIHDTNYPCLLVYGTAGQAVNVIERNILYRSNDNTLQVQGEAIVRNNLVMTGAGNAFFSSNHQGQSVNLKVVHNTFINSGRAVYLSSWADKAGMIFANNVAYSLNNNSILCSGGCSGVSLAGNVVYGSLSGVSSGYVLGAGLSDFTNVSWDASNIDAHPTAGSSIIGAANSTYLEPVDLEGTTRTAPYDSGCYESLP